MPGAATRMSHLGDGEIDVWQIRVTSGAATEPTLLSLLSDNEIAKSRRFRHQRDADRFCVAHASLRILLGLYRGRPPLRGDFVRRCQLCGSHAHGKPNLSTGKGEFQFSLSSAGDVIALAFSRAGAVGVDIEPTCQVVDVQGMCSIALTRHEREELERVWPAARPAAALQCWVRKEALLKAIGVGLAIDPRMVETGVAGERRVSIPMNQAARHVHDDWFLQDLPCTPDYFAALAVQHKPVTPRMVLAEIDLRLEGRATPALAIGV